MTKTLFVPDHVKERLAVKKEEQSNPFDPRVLGLPEDTENLSALERMPKPTGCLLYTSDAADEE